jgi:hypothetical protein
VCCQIAVDFLIGTNYFIAVIIIVDDDDVFVASASLKGE